MSKECPECAIPKEILDRLEAKPICPRCHKQITCIKGAARCECPYDEFKNHLKALGSK